MKIAGRADTPERKKHLIDRLLDVWQRNPDLRLGQMICNVLADPYYAEDSFLINEIEQYYAQSDPDEDSL